MKIAIASDHAGFEGTPPYKPEFIAHLTTAGHEVVDCGPSTPDAVDYPDYAEKVAQAILEGRAERGILMCGTGIGMSISANRFKGIRAATCTNMEMVNLSREHNNANVLCLGRRLLSLEECFEMIDLWLTVPFSTAERHERRVAKMG